MSKTKTEQVQKNVYEQRLCYTDPNLYQKSELFSNWFYIIKLRLMY